MRKGEPVEHGNAMELRRRNRDERTQVLILDLYERVAVSLDESEYLEVVANVREMTAQARETRDARVRRCNICHAAFEWLGPGGAVHLGGLEQPVDTVAAGRKPLGKDGLGRGPKRRKKIGSHEQD